MVPAGFLMAILNFLSYITTNTWPLRDDKQNNLFLSFISPALFSPFLLFKSLYHYCFLISNFWRWLLDLRQICAGLALPLVMWRMNSLPPCAHWPSAMEILCLQTSVFTWSLYQELFSFYDIRNGSSHILLSGGQIDLLRLCLETLLHTNRLSRSIHAEDMRFKPTHDKCFTAPPCVWGRDIDALL